MEIFRGVAVPVTGPNPMAGARADGERITGLHAPPPGCCPTWISSGLLTAGERATAKVRAATPPCDRKGVADVRKQRKEMTESSPAAEQRGQRYPLSYAQEWFPRPRRLGPA